MIFEKPGDKREDNVELKYCEWCGGLWLRRASGADSLCGGCRQLADSFPRLWGAKLKRREAMKLDANAGARHGRTCTSVTCGASMISAVKGEFAC